MKKCYNKEFSKMFKELNKGHMIFNGHELTLYECNEVIRFNNNPYQFYTISKKVCDILNELNEVNINIQPYGIGYKAIYNDENTKEQ